MTIEVLKEKLQKYLDLKKELENKDYLKEIDDEIEAYRVKLLDKYARENAEDLKKVCHYIELIQELLAEEVEVETEHEEPEQIEQPIEEEVEQAEPIVDGQPVEDEQIAEQDLGAADHSEPEASCEATAGSSSPFGCLFSK